MKPYFLVLGAISLIIPSCTTTGDNSREYDDYLSNLSLQYAAVPTGFMPLQQNEICDAEPLAECAYSMNGVTLAFHGGILFNVEINFDIAQSDVFERNGIPLPLNGQEAVEEFARKRLGSALSCSDDRGVRLCEASCRYCASGRYTINYQIYLQPDGRVTLLRAGLPDFL